MPSLTTLPPNVLRRIASRLPPRAAARLSATSKNARTAINVGNRTRAAVAAVTKAQDAIRTTQRRRLLAATLRVARLWRDGRRFKSIENLVERAFKGVDVSFVERNVNPNNANDVSYSRIQTGYGVRGVIDTLMTRHSHDKFDVYFARPDYKVSIARIGLSRKNPPKKLKWKWIENDTGAMRYAYEPLLRELAETENTLERVARAKATTAKSRRTSGSGMNQRPVYTFWGVRPR